MTKQDKIQKILTKDADFTIQNNAYCFLPGDRTPQQSAGTGLLGDVQNWLKGSGKVYYQLINLFGPVFMSFSFRKLFRQYLDKYTDNHVILNLGSGPDQFYGRKDIINVDLFAFKEVDIVADARKLPVEDQSVDFIISLAMLEHTETPEAVIQEMHRILKQDGELVAYAPFIVPYHAAPHDYYRWTYQGAKQLFSSFGTADIFVGCGPTSGMLYVFQEWLSTLLSFGSRTLHDIWFIIFLVLLFPIKYLDILIDGVDFGANVASGFGIIAGKRYDH